MGLGFSDLGFKGLGFQVQGGRFGVPSKEVLGLFEGGVGVPLKEVDRSFKGALGFNIWCFGLSKGACGFRV